MTKSRIILQQYPDELAVDHKGLAGVFYTLYALPVNRTTITKHWNIQFTESLLVFSHLTMHRTIGLTD